MLHRCYGTCLALLALGTAAILPAFGRGEVVIPQVADGAGIIRTKLDFHNLGADSPITRVKLYFYRQNGSPWTLATSQGTASEFQLFLGASQTVRIESLASGSALIAGYAVLRNTEDNTSDSNELRVAVSVFYEVLSGPRVVDTVSVPVGQPTMQWAFPVEFDVAKNLFSGIAIVNLGGAGNRVNLKLWSAFSPSSAPATPGGEVDLSLNPGEQRARFLTDPGLFPDKPFFRGVLVGTSEKPVAILALLQTQTQAGVQYATLEPEYKDSLHTDSYLYLPPALSLDADRPIVRFINVDDRGSADVLYQFVSSTVGRLIPQNGSAISGLGVKSANEFNNLTLQDLTALGYTDSQIDLSDGSPSLASGYTLAVRTALGRYVKVRIAQIVPSGIGKDLALQVYVYR